MPAELDPAEDSFFTYKMDAFLKERKVGTFSTIPNFMEIARLYWFGEFLVCIHAVIPHAGLLIELQRPWFFHEDVKRGEMVEKSKTKSPICFDKDLKLWGY
jgi:hypothetical protein